MNAGDAEEARTVGIRLWRLRDDRRKSLRVVAELAGMSTTMLWRIERGKRALTSQAEVVALAAALQIAPEELTRLPVPKPANGETDSSVAEVDRALLAVGHGLSGGQVLPVEVLRSRVSAAVQALCRCETERVVGAALPGLIRDLHTSIAAGREAAELLPLAAWLHTQATASWLRLAGASADLCGQAVMLAGTPRRNTAAPPRSPWSLPLEEGWLWRKGRSTSRRPGWTPWPCRQTPRRQCSSPVSWR